MQRPITAQLGTALIDLDTPALVVDLAILDANTRRIKQFLSGRGLRLRLDASTHCCPALASEQVAAFGGDVGLAVSTLGEASVFVDAGFRDVFVRNHVVLDRQIVDLVSLARVASLAVVIDDPGGGRRLSAAAHSAGVSVGVFVEVATDESWCGVAAGETAAALAADLARMPGLALRGFTVRAPSRAPIDEGDRAVRADHVASSLRRTKESMAGSSVVAPTLMFDAKGAYRSAAGISGLSEVILDKCGLTDGNCQSCCPDLEIAAHVLSVVTSTPSTSSVIADAGQKTLSSDLGLPTPAGRPGLRVIRLSAEHCLMEAQPDVTEKLAAGSRLWLVPADIGVTAPLHDLIYAGREGRLVGVWSVDARGMH